MTGGRGVSEQRWVLRRRGARPGVWVAGAVAAGELVVLVATAVVPTVGVVIAVGFWLVSAGWVAALATALLRSPRTRRVTGWLLTRLLPASRVWRAHTATGGRVGWVWLRMRPGWARTARGRGRLGWPHARALTPREERGLPAESVVGEVSS